VVALAAVEPLHGLTFALLHLTCMRLLAECVPKHVSATALTLYGTVGIGVPTALLTLASGQLYGRFGAHGFLVMAAFCGAALPVTRMLRQPMPNLPNVPRFSADGLTSELWRRSANMAPFAAEPIVRIHLPPAKSLQTFCSAWRLQGLARTLARRRDAAHRSSHA